LSNIGAHENNHDSMFAQILSQCPFTRATWILSKCIHHLVHDINKALAPHHQNTIAVKGWFGNMGNQDIQGWFFPHSFSQWPPWPCFVIFFFHLHCMHVMMCNGCG